MTVLVDALIAVLAEPPFVVWVVVFTVAALLVRGVGFAVFTGVAFLLVASLELWQETHDHRGVASTAVPHLPADAQPAGPTARSTRFAS